MRNAVQKIRRAVQRIDNPAVPRVRPRFGSALLDQQGVAGACPPQLRLKNALGLQISGRDEFAGSLDGDLKLLDFAEIADETARRLERGVSHDIDDWRPHGHVDEFPSDLATIPRGLAD